MTDVETPADFTRFAVCTVDKELLRLLEAALTSVIVCADELLNNAISFIEIVAEVVGK